jgi:signal transduction histidine kinase
MKKFPSSLRSRIFLTSALLAVLSVGAAVYLVSATVIREAENGLSREITATGAIVNELRTTRAQTFTTLARVIADAPPLKAAVATSDPATVQDVVDHFPTQLNSNLLLVTSRAGRVLGTVGFAQEAAAALASHPAVRNAAPESETTSLVPQPDGLLQLVTVPIVLQPRGDDTPEFLGTLSVGFRLDQAFAAQLKQMTGSEVAFGMNGQILATTLPAEDRPALVDLVRRAENADNVTLRTQEYMALPLPLSSASIASDPAAAPVALILRSRTEQLRFLRAIRTELAMTAIIAAGLAMLLSFAVARTITRPLAAITSIMREVAATGDLTKKIALRGDRDDEDARLLANTFNTLTDSIARFQREMSQKERLSSLGRLSTVIAHEVRNPLMIIKAALHTLRQRDLSTDAVREAAADIDGEVVRLNRIVNEVLDFARPIQFQLAPTDVNALCRDSAAAAEAAPGPSVHLDLDPSLPVVSTDAERLRLALVNLLVNARQAADGDAPDGPRVFLSTRAADAVISILVADTGSGIASGDLARVFDPYFTTKRGGTGLGLPIAKNIVDGLGGTISVASATGRGTQIRIDLPAGEPDGPGASGVDGRPEAILPPEASHAASRRTAPRFATPR